MHIHLSWLMFLVIPVCTLVLFILAPTEQDKLNKTDLQKQFRDKHNLK